MSNSKIDEVFFSAAPLQGLCNDFWEGLSQFVIFAEVSPLARENTTFKTSIALGVFALGAKIFQVNRGIWIAVLIKGNAGDRLPAAIKVR